MAAIAVVARAAPALRAGRGCAGWRSSASTWRATCAPSCTSTSSSSALAFFSRKKTGSLITRVTADTDRLWEFLAFGVVDVSLSLIMLIGLGAVLLSLDWRLGLVMTLPVPLFCCLGLRCTASA